jgi:hypothetical protein
MSASTHRRRRRATAVIAALALAGVVVTAAPVQAMPLGVHGGAVQSPPPAPALVTFSHAAQVHRGNAHFISAAPAAQPSAGSSSAWPALFVVAAVAGIGMVAIVMARRTRLQRALGNH